MPSQASTQQAMGVWGGLLMALLLLVIRPLPAVEVEGLYDAVLPAVSSAGAERRELLRPALAEVLVRVSGSQQVLHQPVIEQALARPEEYVQQFSYGKDQIAGDEANDRQWLKLSFDATLVNRLLRSAKLPLWSSNRPEVLVWVSIDEKTERYTLGADHAHDLKTAILKHAKRRGVPLLFPLMDLQDEIALPPEEAWGMFAESLQSASARYQPKAILAGRVYQNNDQQWTGRWQFMFNGRVFGLNTTTDELASYPQAAIDLVADRLADHYAVNTALAAGQRVNLRVDGVVSLSDYAKLMAYLEALATVVAVSVVRVEEASLLLELAIEGGVEKLEQAIALDYRLLPQSSLVSAAEQDVALYYQWNSR